MFDHPLVRKSRFFDAKLIWMGMILSLLVASGLFFCLGFSTMQVRLNGVQTTAIAHADGEWIFLTFDTAGQSLGQGERSDAAFVGARFIAPWGSGATFR